MGDRAFVTLELFGKIPASVIDTLTTILNEAGNESYVDPSDFDEAQKEGRSLVVQFVDASGGDLMGEVPELAALLKEHKISWVTWFAAYPGSWSAGINGVIYDVDEEVFNYAADDNNYVILLTVDQACEPYTRDRASRIADAIDLAKVEIVEAA